MNKELEEAIKRALETKQRGMCVISVEILQDILTYIDNSISKEVIEKKIKEYKEKIKEAIEEDDDIKEIYYKQEIDILQELLEGK